MPSADRLRPTPFIAGLAGATTVVLTGIWLVAAPFVAAYQPDGADWVDATIIGVATGAGVTLLGLAALIAVAGALRAEVRRRGLAPGVQAAPTDGDAVADTDDEQHVAQPVDPDTVLATLTAALLEDVRNGHHGETSNGTAPSQATTPATAQHRDT